MKDASLNQKQISSYLLKISRTYDTLKSSQTSKMELFAKKVNKFMLTQSIVLNAWEGFKYASGNFKILANDNFW